MKDSLSILRQSLPKRKKRIRCSCFNLRQHNECNLGLKKGQGRKILDTPTTFTVLIDTIQRYTASYKEKYQNKYVTEMCL